MRIGGVQVIYLGPNRADEGVIRWHIATSETIIHQLVLFCYGQACIKQKAKAIEQHWPSSMARVDLHAMHWAQESNALVVKNVYALSYGNTLDERYQLTALLGAVIVAHDTAKTLVTHALFCSPIIAAVIRTD